jgi:putative SOS response-associated peptidase YedK
MFFADMEPESLSDDPPRYNIAPTQEITTVLRAATGQVAMAAKLRWGLVPAWADDLKIGNRMINARGETVDSKPSFRRAFAQRRCLIIADGYYEWKKTSDGKQPYLIQRPNAALMALAGLWEENRKASDDGSTIRTCTIITTGANETTQTVHDRMPVILNPKNLAQWIDPGFRETEKLKQLLVPWDGDRLQLVPVSTHVNSPRNDDDRCVAPI